jgi:hypothetical protein
MIDKISYILGIVCLAFTTSIHLHWAVYYALTNRAWDASISAGFYMFGFLCTITAIVGRFK